MSLDLPVQHDPLVTTAADLVEFLKAAEKPRARHRLGLEHEKFLYPAQGRVNPVAYEGGDGVGGIGALLEQLARRQGTLFREAPDRQGIAVIRGATTISLEPGGQLELSGTAAATAREVHAENLAHIEEVKVEAERLGMQMVALGYRPFATPSEMPWMPKTRYQVMRETVGRKGSLALNMMLMTATGQVSVDWESEADCARKVTVLARAAPLLVALYANSPLVEGRFSGFLSFRSHVWTDVDNTRCGFFPAMIDGTFSYQAYVDWALDVPLLFVRRQGQYRTPRQTFRQLMAEGCEGQPATLGDWRDHLSTLFPEVRLKQVIEFRSADGVAGGLTGALAALLRGLLYDPEALASGERLLPKIALAAHLQRMEAARREGLRNPELRALAAELIGIARAGLARVDPLDLPVLSPLEELIRSGRSPAERVLEVAAREKDPLKLLAAFRL